MINRGNHHVIHDRRELMQRMKDPLTIDVLMSLQEYFEVRDLRKRYTVGGCELDGIREIEKQALLDLINKTQEWLRPSNAKKGISAGAVAAKSQL